MRIEPALLFRVAIIGLLVLFILFVFAQYLRRSSMFYPGHAEEQAWRTERYSPRPADVSITTDDGVHLHGWLFRSTVTNAPLLVWFHGNAGDLTDRAPTAMELTKHGVSVLLFDWRGYGKSEGKPSESGLYRDALAAYDFATHSLATQPQQIVLYGESLGGPFAAYTASKRQARSVIIENSFPSLLALGNALYRPLPLGWSAPFAMRTAHWLNQAKIPVLVMHGKRDQVIPFALGMKLFHDLRGPKSLLVSEKAGHSEIPEVEGARYYESVIRFVQQGKV